MPVVLPEDLGCNQSHVAPASGAAYVIWSVRDTARHAEFRRSACNEADRGLKQQVCPCLLVAASLFSEERVIQEEMLEMCSHLVVHHCAIECGWCFRQDLCALFEFVDVRG